MGPSLEGKRLDTKESLCGIRLLEEGYRSGTA